jgi:hypothetical protein
VGAAIAWQIDNHNVSPMAQLIMNWVTTIYCPLLLVLMVLAVKENNEEEEEPVKQVAPSDNNGSVH